MNTINYEVTYILGETTTEEQLAAVSTWFTKTVETLKGSIEKTENWGKRELAYEIKKNKAGFYTTFWIALPADQVLTLEKELRFDERIIRSLVIKAYTSAQPGSLYPVVEEEQTKGRRRKDDDQPATAEEELRRSTSKKHVKTDESLLLEDEDAEETRMAKLDEALDEIMGDDSKETAE